MVAQVHPKSRSSSCGDCGAPVLLTSAAPVVRASGVVLLCAACRGERPEESAAEPDYDEIEISAAPSGEPAVEGDGAYESISIAALEREEEERFAPPPPDDKVVRSSHTPSASGAIDGAADRARRRSDSALPAVVVKSEKDS